MMPGNIPPPPGWSEGKVPPPQVVMDKTISQDHTQNQDHVFSSVFKAAGRSSVQIRMPVSTGAPRSGRSSPSSSSNGSISENEGATSPPDHSLRLADQLFEELYNKINSHPELLPGDGKASSRVIESLVSTIAKLQIENDVLKEELEAAKSTGPDGLSVIPDNTNEHDSESNGVQRPVIEHIYCIEGPTIGRLDYYKDAPFLFKGDREKAMPRGKLQIPRLSIYLENNPTIAFLTIDWFRIEKSDVDDIFDKIGHSKGVLNQDYSLAGDPKQTKRLEVILGIHAEDALYSIVGNNLEIFRGFEDSKDETHSPPYTLFYMHNKNIQKLLPDAPNVDETAKVHLQILLDWMEDKFRKTWDEADELFSQGKVTVEHINKLFRPGEIVVYEEKDEAKGMAQSLMAGLVSSYPHIDMNKGDVKIVKLTYQGRFSKDYSYFHLRNGFEIKHKLLRTQPNEAIDITELNPYPLRFAPKGLEDKLVARGNKFWRYRKKKLVCSNGILEGTAVQAEKRYMIDYGMFRRIHPHNLLFRLGHPPFVELNTTDKPENSLLACMPPTIHGFDFSTKAWSELRVDHLTDVTWNKTAFDQLVVANTTKELIQAMVTEHGHQANAALDIIEGKGQGLLILLHGGPGTGKTLTAESIAELQERPLYRVTCGDIGTEPVQVEQYLGDVLEIGRSWGCVVLLDEADVFLEERSFSDQKRNAIISIFLRILEYYDGILILTTNRVGSFDEAFKSRIHLALAYPKLNEEDRYKVWSNFINMLQRTTDRVDIDDLKMNLAKLAQHEINGRQIRNVITMSRHLAKFRGEMLRYQHMQDAVQSVKDFNNYLSKVKGAGDEDWARLDKLR